LNVLIVSLGYPSPSNPVNCIFIHEQAKELVKQLQEVHVITYGDRCDPSEEVKDGVHIHRITLMSNMDRLIGLIFSIKVLFKALQICRKAKIDIVHSHFADIAGLAGTVVSKVLMKPFIVTVHGADISYGAMQNRTLKCFVYTTLKAANKIIVASDYIRRKCSEALGINSQKVTVIPNGVDIAKLKRPKNVSPHALPFTKSRGEKMILTVGHLIKRKNHQSVIRALPTVLQNIPNTIYVIVGNGPTSYELKRIVKFVGVSDNVQFVGQVDNEKLREYYYSCDVFIMPSTQEGFGITYLEASACSKPIIGSITTAAQEVIIDGVTGFLVNPLDDEAISKLLVKILNDRQLMNKMGAQGRKIVLEKYLWKHNAQKLIQLYQNSS